MARSYKKRFHVDITTAVSDLQAIGVEFTQEYIDAVKRSEDERKTMTLISGNFSPVFQRRHSVSIFKNTIKITPVG